MIDGIFLGLVFLSFVFFQVYEHFLNKRKSDVYGENLYDKILSLIFREMFFLSLPVIFSVFTLGLISDVAGVYSELSDFLLSLNVLVWVVYSAYLLFLVFMKILGWVGYMGGKGKGDQVWALLTRFKD